MDISRINAILNNKEKCDVFYDDRPVWIQGVNDNKNIAKVGFIDNFEEKDVFITDLYERNLYN
ncbi:MAG: H-type small acid-soluble spore protein [Clostridia bacterium]